MDIAISQFFFSLRSLDRTAFFKVATSLGDLKTIGILFILVAGILVYNRNYRYLKAFVIALAVSEPITYIGKIVFHRARPLNALLTETDYSFPSGHATIAVAFYGFIAIMLMKKQVSKNLRIVIALVAILIILLIGISRLYLGVHYFTDVIAGFVIGSLGVLIGMTFL
ncbi:MAG: phosphoesterase, PA-phosphatase related protein [Candidatus Nomurabacteria bacterium]|nr:phosphoesterase, PA-phosphatase related protein [Candidatus Nomurabacteria bacterium]